MTQTQSADHDRVRELFEARNFDELSPLDWSLLLKSFIREDKEEAASYNRTPLTSGFRQLPNLKTCHTVSPRDRDDTSSMAILRLLEETLSASAHAVLGMGLDLFVLEYVDRLKNGDKDAEEVLGEALNYENYFGPILSGVVAERIALDRSLPVSIRATVVQNMVERPFPMSVSKACWTNIQEEVPQAPAFAAPIMRWLVRIGRGYEALEVPLTFRPDAGDVHVLGDIQTALEEVLENIWGIDNSGWLRDKLSHYPPWALELLRDLASVPERIGGRATQLAALLP